MSLEERMQRLEAEVESLRSQLDDLAAASKKKAPNSRVQRETTQTLMKSISSSLREASLDMNGNEQPMILQAVLDRPGSTSICMATMKELHEQADAAAIVRLASILASEARLKILKTLAAGERSAAEAGAAAGLEGGPLYHHLSELQEGGFVTQPSRGRYAMTRRGLDLYYQVALLVRTPYDEAPHEAGSTRG